jgi:hypothetical protein
MPTIIAAQRRTRSRCPIPGPWRLRECQLVSTLACLSSGGGDHLGRGPAPSHWNVGDHRHSFSLLGTCRRRLNQRCTGITDEGTTMVGL